MDCLRDIVKCQRRRLAGHILRLSRDRIAHILRRSRCSRNTGRPLKTWRKTFKEVLAEMEINNCECSFQMSKAGRPMARKEQEILNLSKSSGVHSTRLFCCVERTRSV